MIPDSLDVLLIEDNPGDARLVREMVESIEPLERRFDGSVGPEPGDAPQVGVQLEGPDVVHADRLSEGLSVLDRDGADIVLLDLNLPDSRGLDTLDAVLEAAPESPVVVLTGVQDREVGLEALDHGAQEYLVKGEINADLLVRTVFHAIQRERYERELERQHERLASLYDISEVVQDVAEDLIDLSTPGEIDSTVCERLVGSGMYRYAWVGHVDEIAGAVSPRAAAAPDGFFDGWTVSIEDPSGPVARAALDDEAQVAQNVGGGTAEESWQEHAREFAYNSVAAFPMEYEGALYGVLVLYSERARAFEEEERGIVERLTNVVGHAINAVERKAALMGDAVIELELLLPGVLDGALARSDWAGNRIEFLATIPAGGSTFLQYADVEGFSEDDMMAVLGAFPGLEDVRIVEEEPDRRLVEARYADPPILSTLAGHGGRVRAASLKEGNYNATITLPADADVRSFLESVRESYPDVDLVAQRSVEPSSSETPVPGSREAALTEKQRAALKAAYFAGYFDQPRTSTGEEIARSLDITASTFHQHLQAGLRKVLAAEFEGTHRAEVDRP